MTELSGQLPGELALATVRLARELRTHRADTRVSLSRLSALHALAAAGPLTPGQLARRERVRPPSMTRVIAALADGGLVHRTSHPRDARQVIVSLSTAGRALVDGETASREAWLESRLAALTVDERALLAGMVEIVNKLLGSPDQ